MYINKFSYLVLLVTFVLMASSASADQNDPLEIINLNDRPAEEIIPIIKPMLKPNDAITGTGFQLFVRTDAKTLEEITRLLQVMDKAPRNLMISVRNNVDVGSESTDFNYSGNYEIGDDTRVIVGDRPPRKEGTRVRINKNERARENDTQQKVRVVEGGKAFISAGELRPYKDRIILHHRYGVSIYDNIDYQDITSGFYVSPQLTGNGNVTMHIQPYFRSANDESNGGNSRYRDSYYGSNYGSIDVQEADTTITAKLGQWVQIGGVDTDAKSRDKGILSTSRSATDRQSSIYIKVDVEQ